MDIVISNPETTVLFNDICVGTAFRWEQWYYMKIEECTTVNRFDPPECRQAVANAVSIDSGLFAHFEPTAAIQLIPMKVMVEA